MFVGFFLCKTMPSTIIKQNFFTMFEYEKISAFIADFISAFLF